MNVHSKHILIMLACCLISFAALTAIMLFKVSVSNVLLIGLALACPLLHLLMMRSMLHDHGSVRTAEQPVKDITRQ